MVVLLFSIIYKTIYPASTVTFRNHYRSSTFFSEIRHVGCWKTYSKRYAYFSLLNGLHESNIKLLPRTTSRQSIPRSFSPNYFQDLFRCGGAPIPMRGCTVTDAGKHLTKYAFALLSMHLCTITDAGEYLYHYAVVLLPRRGSTLPNTCSPCYRCALVLLLMRGSTYNNVESYCYQLTLFDKLCQCDLTQSR